MGTLLRRSISRAVKGTRPFTRERNRALARVRWVLATDDGRFVAVNGKAQALLVGDPAKATVYDGRDNEGLKCRFMEALLKVPMTVVLLDE